MPSLNEYQRTYSFPQGRCPRARWDMEYQIKPAASCVGEWARGDEDSVLDLFACGGCCVFHEICLLRRHGTTYL